MPFNDRPKRQKVGAELSRIASSPRLIISVIQLTRNVRLSVKRSARVCCVFGLLRSVVGERKLRATTTQLSS